MKARRHRVLIASVTLAGAVVAGALITSALLTSDPGLARATEPTASAALIASFSAPTRVAASPSALVAQPKSEAEPRAEWSPPSTESPKPANDEWVNAAALAMPRRVCAERVGKELECSSRCSAKVLREWLQISCVRPELTEVFMGVRVLAGPDKDVTVSDPPQAPGKAKNDPRGVTIVFPVRRGDRRMIELAEMLPLQWKSWTVEESLAMVISVLWLPNEPRPIVSVY